MDITAISAAAASLRATLGITKAAASAIVDHQLKDRLIEVQQGILEAQEKLADATAERLSLLEQVAQLQEKIRVFEATTATLGGYVLHELAPGFKVYKSKPDVGHALDHYACPRCHSQKVIGILQSTPQSNDLVKWQCSVCSFVGMTGQRSTRPINALGRDGSGWMSR